MKSDWWSCDGGGRSEEPAVAAGSEPVISRRGLFTTAALGTIGWLASGRSALSQVAISSTPGEYEHVMVVIFLRGGADGLNVVVPYAEDAYYRLRPSLSIGSPNNRGISQSERSLDLNGFFGLHPSLAPLLPYFASGELSVLHACGSFDQTHSHFDAMSAMERGLSDARGSVSSGWLARYLNTSSTGASASPLRAVAFGNVLPDSLRGASDAIALESLKDFRLSVEQDKKLPFESSLKKMYAKGKDAVSQAGQDTLRAIDTLSRLDINHYSGREGVHYPKSDLGEGLRQVAMLIKSRVGLEVACLDKGGWDTHVAQGGTSGWQSALLADLGSSLSAFAQDLGSERKRVTTVVMTEFGRRAYENSGLGTDHGSGSFMMVLGGGTRGGKVYAQWPGLEESQLFGPGDLKVTTDYRNVLAEILRKNMGNPNSSQIFPGLVTQTIGILA